MNALILAATAITITWAPPTKFEDDSPIQRVDYYNLLLKNGKTEIGPFRFKTNSMKTIPPHGGNTPFCWFIQAVVDGKKSEYSEGICLYRLNKE